MRLTVVGSGDAFGSGGRFNTCFHLAVGERRVLIDCGASTHVALRVRGIDTIVIAGGSTDVGIAATVFAARDMDLGIVVVRDCCYSMRGDNNAFFMDRVFPRMGRVMTVDEAVKLMK